MATFDLKHIDRQSWVRFFTHLIVIIMIFFLPDMMMNYGREHRHSLWELIMYCKAACFVLVFYLNYYVILRRTLFGKRANFLAFIGWNLLIIASFVGLIYYALPQLLLMHQPEPGPMPQPPFEIPRRVMVLREWSYILRDVGMLVLTIGLSTALRFAERWAGIEKRHQQMLATQQADELQNLKNQLNPHFLFNTLNTIYSLIEIDPHEAQDAIHKLSRLLRTVLYDNPSSLPLSQEVDFARSYISLMEMRLGQGIVKADFDNIADPDVEVAPMLFVTLIENAFKHGNTGIKGQSIEISIASTADGIVTCRTFNHFKPKDGDPATTQTKADGGIGLANLRRRLQLIYGEQASLSTVVADNTYTAVLTIKNSKEK